MATALSVYVTKSSLSGQLHVGSTMTTQDAIDHVENFGFEVSTGGLGAVTFNVGVFGEAFGVADHSEVLIIDLLKSVNDQSKDGLLYDINGDGHIDWHEAGLRFKAYIIFAAINWLGR